jgi:hypothetical protein
MSKKAKKLLINGRVPNPVVGIRVNFVHEDGHETDNPIQRFAMNFGSVEHFSMSQTVLGLKYRNDSIKGGKKLLTTLSFISTRKRD